MVYVLDCFYICVLNIFYRLQFNHNIIIYELRKIATNEDGCYGAASIEWHTLNVFCVPNGTL